MKVDVVVDIGNSRIKWGRCVNAAVAAVASLPPDDIGAWDHQFAAWGLTDAHLWAVASVHPARRERFLHWLIEHRRQAVVLTSHQQLPVRIQVERADSVGLDRLLNTVAAGARRQGQPALVVDAGSAVTVDVVDEHGTFRGGPIFPGMRLMAKSLNDYTALLPLVEVGKVAPMVGTSTVTAIESGIFFAVAGAIDRHLQMLREVTGYQPVIFLTGGDAHLLHEAVNPEAILWPEMTLEGLRLSAEALP
jgi:type III pantothenate kinase